MWGIFFGEFQCLLVNDCPAASCDSGVLARGSDSTSFYSAILVPILKQFGTSLFQIPEFFLIAYVSLSRKSHLIGSVFMSLLILNILLRSFNR